ncbi:hypothetical protein SDC9_112892 [bioreactor metagenome]|uniref:Uncharacterized protein n=1 Tax=bioreactor metagenome TaxID=1076179 RepID=A0A645BLI6_9ZZZZ
MLTNCVSIIDDNYDVTQSIENEKVIKAMSNDIIAMRLGNFVFTEWKNGYGIVTRTNKGETITLFNVLEVTFIKALENIIAKDNKSYLYDIIIIHCKLLIEAGELAESSKDFWLKKIDNTKNQSEGLAEQEKKARIESYWSTHADDKTELENEKSKAQSHLTALNEEMDAIPGLSDKKALEEKIDTLKAEKDSIWLFRGKEKKAKQTEIDSLVERVKTLNLTVEPTVNEVQTKIDAVNKRIREIDDELTKDRQ